MIPNQGFSLPELLLTLAILSLLTTLTIPAYKTFLTQAQNQTQLTQLQRALAYARSAAMSRGIKVTLCGATQDHQQCTNPWQNGALIFTDPNNTATITNANQILHVITNNPNNGTLHWRSSFKVPYLQIQPTGTTNGENGTFWYCERNAKTPSWALIVSLAGRARAVTNTVELTKISC